MNQILKEPNKTTIGVDFSLNCPCVCALAEDGTFANSQFFFLTRRKRDEDIVYPNIKCLIIPEYDTEEIRYDTNTDHLINWINGHALPDIWLEGYAMGSKGLVFNIAEATGLLKHKFWANSYPFHLVPPPTVKKFATGKGNADKEAMYKAFRMQGGPDLIQIYFQKHGVKVGSPVTDIVDSFYLAKYGRAQGQPSSTVATPAESYSSPSIPLILKKQKTEKR